MKYLRTRRATCSSCGKSTAGALDTGEGEPIPLCPKCRDTKSVVEALTGNPNSRAQSEYSRHTEGVDPLGYYPMLARAIKDARPVDLPKKAWDSPSWVAAEKYDGVRVLLHYRDGKVYALGRNRHKSTGLYIDRSASIPHLTAYVADLEGTVIDGELLFSGDPMDTGRGEASLLNATVAMTNADPEKSLEMQERYGRLKMVVFDTLRYRGKDLRDQPLSVRTQFTEAVLRTLRTSEDSPFLPERRVTGTREAKKALYDRVIADGGEGIMLKDLSAPYSKNATSRPNSWLKVKKRTTVDAFVTGAIPGRAGFEGLVGALIFSVLEKGEIREIARIANLELELRRQISAEGGKVKREVVGRVAEISFQELSSRAGRGRHATLERWRPDKEWRDCTM